MNIRWRERTNKMQLIRCLLSNFLSQHVLGIIMPISRRIRPCLTACGVLLGYVGCGWQWSCGAASWAVCTVWKLLLDNSNFHTVHTAHSAAPQDHSQPQPTHPGRTPHAVGHDFILLMMGIMMPKTCWDRKFDNKHQISCILLVLSLHLMWYYCWNIKEDSYPPPISEYLVFIQWLPSVKVPVCSSLVCYHKNPFSSCTINLYHNISYCGVSHSLPNLAFFDNFTTNEDIATKFETDYRHTTDTFLFISHTTNVLLFKFRCNIFIGVKIIKEMLGAVVSGTPCIWELVLRWSVLPFYREKMIYPQKNSVSMIEYFLLANKINLVQCVPLATEPGISLIISVLMRILQRNLKRTTDTFLFISHTTNVLLVQISLRYLNLLTPNVNYSGRTAPLTSKVAFYIFIQQI